MSEQSGEKTEEPSEQKLRKAREEGQLAKSRDASTAISFIAVSAALFLVASYLAAAFAHTFKTLLAPDALKSVHLQNSLRFAGQQWLLLSLPLLCVALCAGLAANYMQIGFLFTAKPLKPDPQRINPVKGFKNLLSKDRLVEFIKQLVKFLAVLLIVIQDLRHETRSIVLTQRVDISEAAYATKKILMNIVFKVGLLFFVVAVADYFWQRFSFRKKMMMTKQEVRQEYKQEEGDPEIKGERRRLAFELLFEGNVKKVRDADAVITNPIHIAVAIKYDAVNNKAPVIVAKGSGLWAQKIKDEATKHNIHIEQNVPLAHALKVVPVDEEIPPDLYEAVAIIINFVYEQKQKLPQDRGYL